MKAKWRRYAIGVCALSISVGGYFVLRPNWRTASEAELRAVVDPQLLEPVPKDPEAQARYRRLVAALKPVRTVSTAALSRGTKPPPTGTFLRREGAALKAVRAILNQGPVEAPHPNVRQPQAPNAVVLRSRVLGLTSEGVLLCRAQRFAEGVDLLLLALQLARTVAVGARGFLVWDQTALSVTDATYFIAQCVPTLPEKEVRRMLTHFPETPQSDPTLLTSLRVDFQMEVLPALADPEAWVRRTSPNVDPDLALTRAAITPGRPRSQIVLDGYDALETARAASDHFMLAMKDASQAQNRHLTASEKAFNDRIARLPPDLAAGKTGWALPWQRFQDRVQMRRHPNAFGIQLLFAQFHPVVYAVNPSDERRSNEEAVRALLGLRLYQLQTGNRAPTLDAVVKRGILTSIPYDFFACRPLRYAPSRRRLWSAGWNRHDDAGIRTLDQPFTTP